MRAFAERVLMFPLPFNQVRLFAIVSPRECAVQFDVSKLEQTFMLAADPGLAFRERAGRARWPLHGRFKVCALSETAMYRFVDKASRTLLIS